jgi:hypothetical protein
MTRKMKPVDYPLDSQVAEGVLSLPVVDPEGRLTTIGETVALAGRLLESANKALNNNALATIAAQALMKDQKRRGVPSFVVASDGRVSLHIAYSGKTEATADPDPLPSLGALRARAASVGVDISDLGRQKKAILERLDGCSR